MKKLLTSLLVILQSAAIAQELFPNSEPASIIPMNALGVRLMNEAYVTENKIRIWNGAMFMYGLSPKLMFNVMLSGSNHHAKKLPAHYIHVNGDQFTVSHIQDQNYKYLTESVNLGFRYRFLNRDGDHKHFRMAAYGNAIYSDRPHDEAEVTLMGDNKGIGGGLIATVLLHKLAISATGGFIKPFDYRDSGIRLKYGNAWNYGISFGYLLFPVKYRDYGQTNINLYAEFLGKTHDALSVTKNGHAVITQQLDSYRANSFIEFRPAVQFIIKSNLRIDLSTTLPLSNKSFIRKYPSYLLNVQYYFFIKK